MRNFNLGTRHSTMNFEFLSCGELSAGQAIFALMFFQPKAVSAPDENDWCSASEMYFWVLCFVPPYSRSDWSVSSISVRKKWRGLSINIIFSEVNLLSFAQRAVDAFYCGDECKRRKFPLLSLTCALHVESEWNARTKVPNESVNDWQPNAVANGTWNKRCEVREQYICVGCWGCNRQHEESKINEIHIPFAQALRDKAIYFSICFFFSEVMLPTFAGSNF